MIYKLARKLSGKWPLLLTAIITFSASSVCGQINEDFVKHLSTQKLKGEHFAYLNRYPNTEESISYLWSKYYLQYFDEALFLENYQKSKRYLLTDTIAFTLANILFLTSKDSLQRVWYSSFTTDEVNVANRNVLSMYKASLEPNGTEAIMLPEEIRPIFGKYLKSHSKKPFLAGLFSTALPGAGKLYSGRARTSLVTLLAHASYGASSYESIDKLGIKHPFSLFSLSFLGVFYLANIYGSARSVKAIREELRMQLLIDASDYYKFNYPNGLY